MIASALGIGESTTRSNTALKAAIKKGRDTAKCIVVDKLVERSNESDTALIFLAKQLKVFEDSYTTAKPKNINDAINRIADIYVQASNGDLSIEKADKLIFFLQNYIKAKEVGELESRIEQLEKKYGQ